MQVYKKTIIDILVIFAIITIVFFMAVVTNSKYFSYVVKKYRANETTVLKLEKSLISSVNGYYGMYYAKDENVSIDDINNPYLIAFNIKKYLVEHINIDYDNNVFKWGNNDNWLWDNCIGKSCNTSKYIKLYRVSKTEFNDYMHKTYNTENNYDLLSDDEEKTYGIIGLNIVVDSSEEYYNILNTQNNEGTNRIRTELVKYEEDDHSLYVYDKFVACYNNSVVNACYLDMNPKVLKNPIVNCDEEESLTNNNCIIEKDDSFSNIVDVLNIYKHTFKKVNGNYYWVKTELSLDNN